MFVPSVWAEVFLCVYSEHIRCQSSVAFVINHTAKILHFIVDILWDIHVELLGARYTYYVLCSSGRLPTFRSCCQVKTILDVGDGNPELAPGQRHPRGVDR